MSFKTLSILVLGLALGSRLDALTIIDFSQIAAPGDTESTTLVDAVTGLTVDGFYNNGGGWLGANLYVRDQTNDHGLGVCNPDEAPCPGPDGGGDVNELDNDGAQELIRLTLPAGYEWVSVQLSSLDDNSGSAFEYGQLWADLDGDPTSFDTLLWQFQGDGPIEPSFLIPGFAASVPYLFFQPFDWTRERTTTTTFSSTRRRSSRASPSRPRSVFWDSAS